MALIFQSLGKRNELLLLIHSTLIYKQFVLSVVAGTFVYTCLLYRRANADAFTIGYKQHTSVRVQWILATPEPECKYSLSISNITLTDICYLLHYINDINTNKKHPQILCKFVFCRHFLLFVVTRDHNNIRVTKRFTLQIKCCIASFLLTMI